MSKARGEATDADDRRRRVAHRATALLVALTLAACAGRGGSQLRGADGSLAPCPGPSRCVSSLDRDPETGIEPFYYRGRRESARERLLLILRSLPQARVVAEQDDYIHVQFSRGLLGYVDDVEFLLPTTQKLVHVRAAASVGLYDGGANRERVEMIRDLWAGAGVP